MDSEFIRQARAQAEKIFKARAFEKHLYHNLDHTQDVVNAVGIIGQHTNLTADEMESAVIAAWLHDVGYENGSKNHEQASAQKAKELLESLGATQRKITDVTEAILATRMPQDPKTIVSQVLCDADLFHLSTDSCLEKSGMLRDEWKALGVKDMRNNKRVANFLN